MTSPDVKLRAATRVLLRAVSHLQPDDRDRVLECILKRDYTAPDVPEVWGKVKPELEGLGVVIPEPDLPDAA